MMRHVASICTCNACLALAKVKPAHELLVVTLLSRESLVNHPDSNSHRQKSTRFCIPELETP